MNKQSNVLFVIKFFLKLPMVFLEKTIPSIGLINSFVSFDLLFYLKYMLSWKSISFNVEL